MHACWVKAFQAASQFKCFKPAWMKGYKQLFREHANQDLESCFDMLIGANLKSQKHFEVYFYLFFLTEARSKEFRPLRLNLNFDSLPQTSSAKYFDIKCTEKIRLIYYTYYCVNDMKFLPCRYRNRCTCSRFCLYHHVPVSWGELVNFVSQWLLRLTALSKKNNFWQFLGQSFS